MRNNKIKITIPNWLMSKSPVKQENTSEEEHITHVSDFKIPEFLKEYIKKEDSRTNAEVNRRAEEAH